MGDFEKFLLSLDGQGHVYDTGPRAMLASLLAALFLGQLLAWVYSWTHTGLSYSRTFTQSIVLLTIISSLVMYVIGDSVVTAFGLIGALAIIRFRNVLKDTRDTTYVFFALVVGMALGSQRYHVAILGGAALILTSLYLHIVGFGGRDQVDGHLTLRLVRSRFEDARAELAVTLARFCRRSRQVTLHDEGDHIEQVLEVRLRDPGRGRELVDLLRATPGVGDVALVQRDTHAEL